MFSNVKDIFTVKLSNLLHFIQPQMYTHLFRTPLSRDKRFPDKIYYVDLDFVTQ